MTEQDIQDEAGKLIYEIHKEINEAVAKDTSASYQDIMNILLIREIAKLRLEIKKNVVIGRCG